MTTSVNSYESRIQQALKQATATQTFGTGMPTVGLFDLPYDTSILGTVAKTLIFLLLAVFVVLLILVILHYAGVIDIFKYIDNPIPTLTSDWVASWGKKDVTYSQAPSSVLLPQSNYSFTFDTKVLAILPSQSTGNIYVMVYKTTTTDNGPFVEGFTNPSCPPATPGAGGSGATSAVATPAPPRTRSQLNPNEVGVNGRIYTADEVTDFSFLDVPQVPTLGKPSLVVAYDAIAGAITVYFVVTGGSSNYLKSVSAPIKINQKYRVGVVVAENLVELYLNGQLASSKVYPGLSIQGTNTDILVSTPAAFTGRLRVGNLFTTGRVVSSGEIRSMGGPADINEK